MRDRYAIILAAGKGARMESNNPKAAKVSFPVLGKALINYSIDAVKPLVKQIFVVVGYGAESIIPLIGDQATIVEQKEILGTGHAVMQVLPYIKDKDIDVVILNGDTPLLTTETLEKVIHKYEKNQNKLTICTTVLEKPQGYGRVVRERPSYRIKSVVPNAELTEEEAADINEINSGIYIVDNKLLQHYLPKLSKDNKKNEYYLSDIVKLFTDDSHLVEAYVLEDAADIFNINDRIQLAYAAKVMRKRVNQKLMLSGVSIEDPDTAYISPEVIIGKDTVIGPNTHIIGKCVIGENNFIGPNAGLYNVKMGNNNVVVGRYLENVTIKDNEKIMVK